MVKVFDEMRVLKKFTDKSSPGRDWNLATAMVAKGDAGFQIMGDWAKIHPVLVIFSLLVGEHFFQATGALLAVPTMSIAQSLFLHFREVVERDDPAFARRAPGEAGGAEGRAAFADRPPPG